ncbi:hypothetical protein MKX01_033856 [Papaver californicum]|nr:hypothetical protein MKX01_033856 [Papaver californicum]
MFKQSSRNQRSKGGFKVKHALQLGVLLVVCIWLLHKVNRSDDIVEETITNVSEKVGRNVHEISRIGRKGLLPSKDNQDDEEEENVKPGETEIHMGGVGDDEIDEHNQQHSEGETEKEEQDENENEENDGESFSENEVHTQDVQEENVKGDENEGEEKEEKNVKGEENEGEEKEEKSESESEEKEKKNESEEKEEKKESENSAEDKNTQDAREENYKGDDASSAIVRDNQILQRCLWQ